MMDWEEPTLAYSKAALHDECADWHEPKRQDPFEVLYYGLPRVKFLECHTCGESYAETGVCKCDLARLTS